MKRITCISKLLILVECSPDKKEKDRAGTRSLTTRSAGLRGASTGPFSTRPDTHAIYYGRPQQAAQQPSQGRISQTAERPPIAAATQRNH